MEASPAGNRLDRATVLALVAMGLGVFVIANDFTALSVAIPEIESDLDTSLNRSQWVINGYAVVFGVLIVTGGRLADQFGRRRVFMIGASVFAVFGLHRSHRAPDASTPPALAPPRPRLICPRSPCADRVRGPDWSLAVTPPPS